MYGELQGSEAVPSPLHLHSQKSIPVRTQCISGSVTTIYLNQFGLTVLQGNHVGTHTLQGLEALQSPLQSPLYLQVIEASQSDYDAVQPVSLLPILSMSALQRQSCEYGELQGSEALQSPLHLQVI